MGAPVTHEAGVFGRHIRPLRPLATGAAPRLSGMRRFDAMLFDVYGTLLVSAAGDIGAPGGPSDREAEVAAALRRHGIRRAPEGLWPALRRAVEREHARLRHDGVDHPEVEIVGIWQEVLGVEDREKAAAFALEAELIVNPAYPMPGLRELLSACRAGGVTLGIVSNAQFYTLPLLEHLLGAPLHWLGFERRLVFLSYLWGAAKPSPLMFERAAGELCALGISAGSALYVGNDMLNDILPAGRSGFRTALFAGDSRSLRRREEDERCRGLSPDLVVTDLRQLIAGTRR